MASKDILHSGQVHLNMDSQREKAHSDQLHISLWKISYSSMFLE